MVVKYGGVEGALRELREQADAIREYLAGTKVNDPTIEELQRAMGPALPPGYITVILALENLIIQREWDRRYGWRVRVRPGAKEALQKLTELGACVTFWSDQNSAIALETVTKIITEFAVPIQLTPLHLGADHCFTRRSDNKKEKHIDHFNREKRTILLVDWDPLSEDLNPENTVVLKSFKQAEEEAKAAADAGRTVTDDVSLKTIVALVSRIRADASMTGQVDVPRTMAAIRREAAENGFSTDAAGVYAFIQAEAAAEAERERERKEAGVGGLMRRTLQSSSLFAGKLTVAEAAAARAPSAATIRASADEDTLMGRALAKKQAQLASMFARPGQGGA